MFSKTDLVVLYPNNRVIAYGDLMHEIAAVTPPVDAGLLVASVRHAGHSVIMLDAEQQNLSAKEAASAAIKAGPRLICICTDFVNSGDVTKMAAATETLREIKAQNANVPVILQGVVPTAYPEKMLNEERCDLVCQGEPYEVFPDLLKWMKDNEGQICPPQDLIHGVWGYREGKLVTSTRRKMTDPNKMQAMPWDIMPPTLYRAHHWHCFDDLNRRTPYAAMYTNLGCPFGCTFCSVNVVAGQSNFRQRSIDDVVKELDLLVNKYGVRNIRLLDNVFTIRLDLVEELCDKIIAHGWDLNFWAYARVETVRNIDILKKMKKAGVNWLAYGIEAASERVRKAVDKNTNPKFIERAIEMTKEADIAIVGNFIFGLPEDDLESIQMSFDMAKHYNFEWSNFYCAMAYPGTILYDQIIKEGTTELPKTWSGFGQYSADALPLSTKYLKSADILKFRDEAFIEYYTAPRYHEMLTKKFGPAASDFVKKILTIKMPRRKHVQAEALAES